MPVAYTCRISATQIKDWWRVPAIMEERSPMLFVPSGLLADGAKAFDLVCPRLPVKLQKHHIPALLVVYGCTRHLGG